MNNKNPRPEFSYSMIFAAICLGLSSTPATAEFWTMEDKKREDKALTDKNIANDQVVNEQIVNGQVVNGQTANDQATNEQVTNDQALASNNIFVEEGLEELSSVSTDIPTPDLGQTDNSRIYLPQGAIWSIRDMTRFSPVLNLTVSDEAEVQDGKLLSELNFNVDTNYGYYIARWQVEIFDGHDRHLSAPLAQLSGEALNNDMSIAWRGEVTGASNSELKSGKQLIYRLKAWDKDGNMDVTDLGVIDLVRPNKEVSITKNDSAHRQYGEAKLLRHNIPTYAGVAKFMGSGLYDVDSITIGEEEFDVIEGDLYAEQFLPVDSYLFPTTVTYKDGSEAKYELYARIPKVYWAQTGLADVYIGRNYVHGNKDALSVDDQYQGDIFNRGRLAYFGQGKFGDKWRVTAHFDSKEDELKNLFNHPFSSESTDVFDLVEGDDEMYYGTYGDGSNINKVVNTRGKVYLDVQYDKSQLLWGTYNTGVTGTQNSDYNRSMYGLKLDYRTRATTQYGEDRFNLVAFGAEAGTLYSHEEFLGTGGSLYFLKHGEVAAGSDKVLLKVVNKTNNNTVQEIVLQSGRDYEIDEFQGRIILTRPLSQIAASQNETLINNTPSGDLENYLVVDYEYVPDSNDALGDGSYGGRAKLWASDHIGLGATYVTENRDNVDYQVGSGDVILRATEGTYIKAEFSTSEGQQSNSNFVSFDGGLTFSQISRPSEKREGDSLQITANASLYDLAPSLFGAIGNDVSAWYKEKDAGYSSASQFDDLEQLSYGGQVNLQLSDRVRFMSRYSTSEETDLNGDKVTDNDEVVVETEVLITDRIAVSVAGQQVAELNRTTSNSQNSMQQGKGVLVGAQVEYRHDDNTRFYVKGQNTLSQKNGYESNDSVSVGSDWQITDDLALSGEYTTGDRGNAAQASVNYDITDNYTTYLGYMTSDYDDENTVTVGQRANVTSSVDMYTENQFVTENNGKGRIDSFGFDVDVTDDLDVGIAYQQGFINYRNDPSVERNAVSLYSKVDKSRFYLSNKLEYRIDKGATEVEQWVTTNRYTHYLTDEYTLYAKFNYSIATDKTEKKTVEKFVESGIGLAYRPVFNDDLNLLARYTYMVDYDETQRDVSSNNEKSHIVETEAVYSVNSKVDVGAKFAYKDKTEDFKRQSGETLTVNNDIYLVGANASYKVMNDWDITGEYHWKIDEGQDQVEQGAIVSVNKHLSENFKMGVGYNFSSFSDDLVHEDNYDANGFFINFIGKF